MPFGSTWMLLIHGLAVFTVTVTLTGYTLKVLREKAILDTPNERSNHEQPTPRGGGIAIAIAVFLAWCVLFLWTGGTVLGLSAGMAVAALGLCAVSWWDDVRPLSAGIRLLAHLSACILGAMSLGSEPVLQGLVPLWLDRAIVVLVWAGFVNFFNFMDGIDAISGVEAAGIGLGLTILALLPGATGLDAAVPLTLVSAALGFLVWNRPPAKLFMGDVGSIPLGFVLGWLLLVVAQNGYWAAALLLPAYYLADGGLTLLRRALRGEKIWQAHREHFYQRAVARRMGQQGLSRTAAHGRVSGAIAFANVGLVACAVLSLSAPWIALAMGASIVVGLMTWMVR